MTATQEIIDVFKQYVIGNYGRLPYAIARGEGDRIWDVEGREYLDMFPGWGTSVIGHCHPKVVQAVQKQVAELIHMDNTFYTEPQGRLARLLSERAFGGQCFFCSSGAEANEAAFKLARKHTAKERYKIIAFEGGFHGRTFAAITATAQPKYHQGFSPLVPGFVYAPFNDIDALRSVFDDEVAAVIVEPIQGEGGIRPAEKEFLQAIRDLCDEHGALAIWDEVQCGLGRTGEWFGYQLSEVEPDIMTLAKGMGGGVAVGAMMARPEVAASLTPGSHAATFGGNPLACVASIATIEAIEEENMLENAREIGGYTRQQLERLAQKHSIIEQVRGLGVMLGIELNEPGAPIVQACWDRGMRVNCTHETILRFYPTMNAKQERIDQAIEILDAVLTEHESRQEEDS